MVSPSEEDKFYLRLLLSHVTGPTSWEYILTNNGTTFNTFKKSTKDKGFLEIDHCIHDCLVEAASLRMPYALRRLFVTVLIFCEPTDVRGLWNEFFTHMAEDYQTTNNVVESNLTNILLKDLNELLNLHDKKIGDYDLPSLPPNTIDRDAIPSIIQEELAVDIPNEDIEYVAKLNNDQMIAFKTIMNVIVQKNSGVFFVDGPGGTAATLLPGGRTAHSRFKIPIDIQPSSICGIQKQKDLANLIRCHLWNHTKILRLRQNIRSLHDQEFAEFLIRIGDGVEPTKLDDMVRLPSHIAIPSEGEHSIQALIQHIFPNLELYGWDAPYMVQRAILTPTNDDVQKFNDMIIDQFPGEEHNLLPFDEVEGDNNNLYQQEFSNSIAQGSFPPHILNMKKGAPLMLLRNLDPRYRLCNGT
ncbi:hypothetical protein KIW84_033865 [Lathyrus oleraceus]|uniref:ATP-dependent DNA helicase n=1 Tax=Pisum sativum TaxID=3888 RepID=A0A9D4XY05_PEA|nr:hypothetical protein KIW84_033865 [Pisum sativum]